MHHERRQVKVLLTSFLRHVDLDRAIEQLAGSLHLGVIPVHAVFFLAADVAVECLRHKLGVVVSLLEKGKKTSVS